MRIVDTFRSRSINSKLVHFAEDGLVNVRSFVATKLSVNDASMVCGKVIGNHKYTLFSGKYFVPNVSKRSLWTK
jgi:hypothetical protein